jgi:pimeloyl-ACP methyl ester carboxylesterase
MLDARRTLGLAAAALVAAAGLMPVQAAAGEEPRTFDVEITGQGRPVILIPGLSTTGEVWAATVEHLKDLHEVHVLTLAGFGGPPPIGEPFLPRVVDEVIDHARRTGRRPLLVGHSLGGFVAFAAASKAPDAFGGVLAVDGVPFVAALANAEATPATVAAQAAQIKAMYATLTPSQLAAQSRLALAGMITDPDQVELAAGWAARSDAAAVGIAVAEMMTTDLRDAVGRIDVPVHLIGALGAAPEPMRPAFRAAYKAQVRQIPYATLVFAERARHFVMLDDPAYFRARLDAFLADAAGREVASWTR